MRESENKERSKPDRPYKRWDYFEQSDHSIFFGRVLETRLLFSEILSSRLVLLYAKSGTGKTSLINAGVRPMLEDLRFRTFVIRTGIDALEAIKSSTQQLMPETYHQARHDTLRGYFKSMINGQGESVVLFLDQFEEFFIHLGPDEQERFVSEVAELYHDTSVPVFLIFSLREDFFVEMDCFRSQIPTIFENNSNLRLKWFDKDAAKEAIEEPAKLFGSPFESDLVDKLLDDLQRDSKAIEPIRLQLVCDALWDAVGQGKSKKIKLGDYENLGGVNAIEERAFNDALKTAEEADSGKLLPSLLRMLITEAGTKNYLEAGALAEKLRVRRKELEKLLGALQQTRLVRVSRKETETFYELSHDYLVRQVQRWLSRTSGHPELAKERAAELTNKWKQKREPIAEADFYLINQERALVELDPAAIEMLAQAAVYYRKNVPYWLDRLGKEEPAISLIRKLYERYQEDATRINCLFALGEMRSSAATKEIAQIAILENRTIRKRAIELLKERADSSTLYDLYDMMRDQSTLSSGRENASLILAALRRSGIALPLDWSRSQIYSVMAWMADSGDSLREDDIGGPPALLGRALELFENARVEGPFSRALSRLRIQLIALFVGLYRGLWGALGGAILGMVVGFLYALFQNLIGFFTGTTEYARFSGRVLLHGYGMPVVAGLKFGIFLGWLLIFALMAGQVWLRAKKATVVLEAIQNDKDDTIPR